MAPQASDPVPVQIVVVKDFADPMIDSYLHESEILCFEPVGRSLGSWIAQVLSVAEAPVLAFLDDDDLFLPGRIEAIDQEFRKEPRAGYYRNGLVRFRTTGETRRPPPGVPPRIWWVDDAAKGPRTIEAMWRAGAAFNHSSIAVRRELVERFRPELELLHDGYSAFLFYAALISSYGVALDPHPRTLLRLHPGNESPLAEGARSLRWDRTFRLAGAREHDAGVILDLVHRRRPGLWTRPLERVRARNELYLSWTDPSPSRARRARALGALVRADGPRNLPGDLLNLGQGGIAIIRRRWVPMASTARRAFHTVQRESGEGGVPRARTPPSPP